MQYKIVRSRRKTVCVTVSPENEITVRCPNKVSEKAIEEFLESRKLWIEKIVAKNEKKLSENRAVTNYGEIFVSGKRLPLIICDVDKITSSAVYVRSVKNLKNLFFSELSADFIKVVDEISRRTDLFAESVSFRKYKSRWGCCDSKKNITFNFLLFMLPVALQRYVIIHELCHTVYMNHSPDFWRLVRRFEPDYAVERKQLKNFDFLTALY